MAVTNSSKDSVTRNGRAPWSEGHKERSLTWRCDDRWVQLIMEDRVGVKGLESFEVKIAAQSRGETAAECYGRRLVIRKRGNGVPSETIGACSIRLL